MPGSGHNPLNQLWQNVQGISSRRLYITLFALVLIVASIAYFPGLSGPFLLDDTANLQQLGDQGGISGFRDAMQFMLGNSSGPTGRPVAMASFLLNGQDWPASSAGFKVTNLVLHLSCGVLAGWLSLLLFRRLSIGEATSRILAVTVAAFWLLHPLNVSTTLYVVQRMTQLMALFSLGALICYLKGREVSGSRPARGLTLMCLALFPFAALAVLSKENGALVLLAILSLEATLFAGTERSRAHGIWLTVCVVAPMILVALYMITGFENLTAAYRFREFSLTERLMTESRVVIDYLVNIFLPYTPGFTLHHDAYSISRSPLEPLTTLFSLVFLSVMVVLAIRLRRRQKVFSFAVFWFLGWHLLESTFLPLELYFEHRNYLAMLGPLIAVVYYGYSLATHYLGMSAERLLRYLFPGVTTLLTLLTFQLASLWGNSFALAAHWAEQHPGSYRAQVEWGYLLAAAGEPVAGYEVISAIQQRYPDEAAMQMQRWNYACTYGLPEPFPVGEIAGSEQSVYFRADLTTEVKTFLENLLASQCSFPPRSELEDLMNRLAEVPMRNFERSGFHLLFSDFYVHFRELNPALIQLRNAFEIRPDPFYLIRQANLAASAGAYQESLVFLQRAREADENRGLMNPGYTSEIDQMELEIQTLLEAPQGQQ